MLRDDLFHGGDRRKRGGHLLGFSGPGPSAVLRGIKSKAGSERNFGRRGQEPFPPSSSNSFAAGGSSPCDFAGNSLIPTPSTSLVAGWRAKRGSSCLCQRLASPRCLRPSRVLATTR